jgi:hypothetical protein
MYNECSYPALQGLALNCNLIYCVTAYFRSVFMWDLYQFRAYSQDFSFEHSKCFILVAKISSSEQENQTRLLLEIAEQVPIYEKMLIIISDREIFSQDPGFHQLVTLAVNVGK